MVALSHLSGDSTAQYPPRCASHQAVWAVKSQPLHLGEPKTPTTGYPQRASVPAEQAWERKTIKEVLPGRAIGEQPQGSPLGNTTKGGSQGRTSREHHKRGSPGNTIGDASEEHREGGPLQRASWGRVSIECQERDTPGERYSWKTSGEEHHEGEEVPDKERVVGASRPRQKKVRLEVRRAQVEESPDALQSFSCARRGSEAGGQRLPERHGKGGIWGHRGCA